MRVDVGAIDVVGVSEVVGGGKVVGMTEVVATRVEVATGVVVTVCTMSRPWIRSSAHCQAMEPQQMQLLQKIYEMQGSCSRKGGRIKRQKERES